MILRKKLLAIDLKIGTKKIVALLILFTLTLFQPVNAKTDFAGFVSAIEDSRKLKITIDFENTAKQFGYKDFKQFFDEYKKKYDLDDVTIDEAKGFLTGTDRNGRDCGVRRKI